VVTSEQGQLLMKSWRSLLNFAGFPLCVEILGEIYLRHNERAVECCAIALQFNNVFVKAAQDKLCKAGTKEGCCVSLLYICLCRLC